MSVGNVRREQPVQNAPQTSELAAAPALQDSMEVDELIAGKRDREQPDTTSAPESKSQKTSDPIEGSAAGVPPADDIEQQESWFDNIGVVEEEEKGKKLEKQ